jgi:predicted RNase H-like nuclease
LWVPAGRAYSRRRPSWHSINRRTRERARWSTSAQGWAIGRAILEVQRFRDARVREVHPEVSFAALAGRPLAFGKKTWNGHHDRTALIHAGGIDIPRRLDAGLVAADDVLDAAVTAWTATRIARAEHRTLPADPRPGEPVIHY